MAAPEWKWYRIIKTSKTSRTISYVQAPSIFSVYEFAERNQGVEDSVFQVDLVANDIQSLVWTCIQGVPRLSHGEVNLDF